MNSGTHPALFLVRVVLYGDSLILAGFVWAWALGATLWHRIAPGAVLGLGAVLLFGTTSETERTGGPDAAGIFASRTMFIALLLALSIVGAIVRLIIRLVPDLWTPEGLPQLHGDSGDSLNP